MSSKSRWAGRRAWRNGAALMGIVIAATPVTAQQCNPKQAGYFTQMAGFNPKQQSPLDLVGLTASLTGSIGNPLRGREIVVDASKGACLNCHNAPAATTPGVQGDLGPSLSGVGGRYTPAQLRQIIVDPDGFFPDTVMPAYHKPGNHARIPEALAGKPVLTAAQVEDVVAYLANLK